MSFTSFETVTQRLHRSELAVPASNPKMIEKASRCAADVVFLDLEDSVAPDDKARARRNAIAALNDIDWGGKTVSVRVNGLDTHYTYRDVIEIVPACPRLDLLFIPKIGLSRTPPALAFSGRWAKLYRQAAGRNYRALHNHVTSLDPSPPTPLPEGEGSVERNRTVVQFRNYQWEESMKTLKQLLQSKPPGIFSIAPDARVFDALQVMAEKNVGALLVMDAGRLLGIITERDYARKVILQGKSSLDTPVREIMTDQVLCVHPDQSVEECMGLMTDKRVRHLPVMDGDELIGVLSIGDLVKETISEQQFVIKQLESYIHR